MVEGSNSGEGSQEHRSPRISRRTELRYRLAQLLKDEKFAEALDEATLARRRDEIQPEDFEFVANIVTAAARMGRVKIEPQRDPAEPPRPSLADEQSA
jgi:hypothetical protein